MSTTKETSQRFRDLLAQPGFIMLPGVFNPVSALLAEKAGFPAVYMTGYGVAANYVGYPDIGLMTMNEICMAAKSIANTVSIPVIADGDTGFGGLLNVARTVEEYIRAGVAAIQLEDQVMPKRCGHMEGKELTTQEDMIARIHAAVDARKDSGLVIIARTDARAVLGLEAALERANAYVEAGADVIFVEAPQSEEEMKQICSTLQVPLLANMVEGGKTPFLKAERLSEMGYKMAIYPVSTLYTATKAMEDVLSVLQSEGTTASCMEHLIPFGEFNKLIRLKEFRDKEQSYR